MTILEREIEAKLRLMVVRAGGKCLKWVCPGWSGVPDRIVLLPHGRIVFVELKRPKGSRVSELQRWWAKELRALGFKYEKVKNVDDLANFQRQYIRDI